MPCGVNSFTKRRQRLYFQHIWLVQVGRYENQILSRVYLSQNSVDPKFLDGADVVASNLGIMIVQETVVRLVRKQVEEVAEIDEASVVG